MTLLFSSFCSSSLSYVIGESKTISPFASPRCGALAKVDEFFGLRYPGSQLQFFAMRPKTTTTAKSPRSKRLAERVAREATRIMILRGARMNEVYK